MFESHDLQLTVAHGIEWGMCAGTLAQFHYLHTFPDPRCMPMVYSVRLRKTWVGALVFGRPEASRCFRGGITYGGRADLAAGRCRYDRWEVLNLAGLAAPGDPVGGLGLQSRVASGIRGPEGSLPVVARLNGHPSRDRTGTSGLPALVSTVLPR